MRNFAPPFGGYREWGAPLAVISYQPVSAVEESAAVAPRQLAAKTGIPVERNSLSEAAI
jgi:hypothetical protein